MKKSILLIITAFAIASCGPKKVTPEIFLIPSDYRGAVKIIFNQPCGSPESMKDNKRVYIVPESGILITQFKPEFGIINQEYYYTDVKGGRTLIPKMMLQDFNEATTTKLNEHEPPRDQVGVFGWGDTGIMEEVGGEKYNYFMFYIGTYTEVRDSFSTLFDGDGIYMHQFDSITDATFRLCKSATIK